MPQLLEVNKRLVALDKLRPARRFPERTRRLGQAEETVELGQDTDCAQPDAPVCVKLGVETNFELFDGGVAVLARLLQLPNSCLQGGYDVSLGSLCK